MRNIDASGPRRRAALIGLPGLLALPGLWPGAAAARAAIDAPALEQAAERSDLHAVLVWQRGAMLFERYRRSGDKPINDWFTREVAFGPETLHDMRSISKSVVGLLVGQAVARGQIDVERPVLDHFPDLADLRSGGRDAIRVSHLLGMSSGLDWNEGATRYGTLANDETRLAWDGAPARYILGRPLVAAPGTRWNYNGGHTVLLAEILAQRSGRPLTAQVQADLFQPLGITNWEWRCGLHGQPLAYAGLRLTPADLLRLGRLMLDRGRWQGREVLPADWVAASMRPRLRIGDGPLQYGWHWWCGNADAGGRSVDWAAGFGNGGQRLFVVPALEMAVVFTAGAYNSGQIGPAELGLFRRIVGAAS